MNEGESIVAEHNLWPALLLILIPNEYRRKHLNIKQPTPTTTNGNNKVDYDNKQQPR